MDKQILKRKKKHKPIVIPEFEEFQVGELIMIWWQTKEGAKMKALRHVEGRETEFRFTKNVGTKSSK